LLAVGYEYSHNPELFRYTRAGKIEALRQTATGGPAPGAGTLAQAGATATGFARSNSDMGATASS